MERSIAFYRDVLELPQNPREPTEFEAGNVTLALWKPEDQGVEFSSGASHGIALRVADVAAARAELEARGVAFIGVRGFDPDAFLTNGHVQGPGPGTRAPEGMLDVDVSGLALVSEDGITIDRAAPEGVIFEPFEDHERLGQLVGSGEKFAAHNAAVWEHGLLVVVPKGVELEKPLAVRIVNSGDQRALFFRLLVIAEPESRFSLIEEYVSASGEVSGYTNAVGELFVEQAAKLEYVSIQSLSLETWHFASHHARVERDAELDWVAGGFGSKKGKVWIENDLTGPGATSRVTGAYFADGSQHLD